MKRLALITLLIGIGTGRAARAEVAVEKDSTGAYQALRMLTKTDASGKKSTWARDPTRPQDDYLNEGGDACGDGAPVAVVLPAGTLEAGPTPLVVWLHSDGHDLELYYATWRRTSGWQAPRRLTDD